MFIELLEEGNLLINENEILHNPSNYVCNLCRPFKTAFVFIVFLWNVNS